MRQRVFLCPVLNALAVWSLLFGVGCSAERSDEGPAIATSRTLADVVAGPISDSDLRTVVSLMASLPEGSRPAFEPAVDPVDATGLRAVEILATYRRAYASALEVGRQADRWRRDTKIESACGEHGLTTEKLAVLLTRIGCAYHSAESGTSWDVSQARSDGEAKIAELLPKIDASEDELTRETRIEILASLVAFDTYLTLLDHVPAANREVVAVHREVLASVLPPTPQVVTGDDSVASEEQYSTR